MPRHSLGQQSSTGASRKLEVKLPAELRAAVEAALREGETLSEFVREAMADEVKRRKKR